MVLNYLAVTLKLAWLKITKAVKAVEAAQEAADTTMIVITAKVLLN